MRTLIWGLIAFTALGIWGCTTMYVGGSAADRLSCRANTHYWEAILGKDTIQIKYIHEKRGLAYIGNKRGRISIQYEDPLTMDERTDDIYISLRVCLDTSTISRGSVCWNLDVSEESTRSNVRFSRGPINRTLSFEDICVFKPLLDAEGQAYADSLHAIQQDSSIKFTQVPYNPCYKLTPSEEKYLRKNHNY